MKRLIWTNFEHHDWKPLYGNIKEAILPDAPADQGKEVELLYYIDADHDGNLKTRCLQTGFLIFLNKAPVDWYYKRHNTVEYSVFGSKFFAQNMAMERLHGLHYKLRMMSIPMVGTTYMYEENI